MAFFEDAIEILRRIVVAVGTERFIDSLAKTCEKIDTVDYKAKGQKINNYKIRLPNSFSLSNMVVISQALSVVSTWLQRTVGICIVQDQHLVQENFFSTVRKDNYGYKSKCAKRFIQGKREGGVQSHQAAADLFHASRHDWSAHLFSWEHRKLGELASFSKGSGYSKSDLTDTGTPIILYGRLYTKYETVISEVDTFVDTKSGSVYSKGGEVIVPGSGETAEDISLASVVENAGVLLGGDLNIITPPEEIDSAFMAISISNGKPHKDMAKMAQGKSVVHLHNSDFGKIDLPYPSMEEQRKISGTFANLDNLITHHQRLISDLVIIHFHGCFLPRVIVLPLKDFS